MTTQDYIPFYDHTSGQHMRATLQSLKEAIGVQSPSIKVTTCAGAAVTCSDGETTLQGTGTTEFELPHIGEWTVTATLDGESASQEVEVTGALLYEVDLMITSGVAVTTQPTKTTYYIGEAFDPTGMVVTATFADDTTENVTNELHILPHQHFQGHHGHHRELSEGRDPENHQRPSDCTGCCPALRSPRRHKNGVPNMGKYSTPPEWW